MFRSLWLRNWSKGSRSRKDRRRQMARCRKPVRLMLESLEVRLTPSGGNPIVTQAAGGYTALTAEVAVDAAANTNYVIQITNSFQFNYGGQVNISKLGAGSTLTIEGQSGTNYTLAGNDNGLFQITSGQNVTFKDLTLTGGVVKSNSNAQGGAINDGGGNVTLSAVNVQGNSVTGSLARGGGIYVSRGGSLTMQGGCVIQSNNATGTSFAEGGGVYVSGASTVAISDSILSKNSATGEQGANGTSPGASGSYGGTAEGGGLDVNGSGWSVTLTGDTLSGNFVISGNGGNGVAGRNATQTNASGSNGGSGGESGAAEGGGAYFFVSSVGNGHLTILNDPNAPTTNPSTFLDNSAQSGAGGNGGAGGASDPTGTATNSNGGNGGESNPAVGGALFMSCAVGGTLTATLSNTIISGNKVFGAKGGAGGAAGTGGTGSAGVAGTTPGGSSAEGGGVVLGIGVVATINNSKVANNTAAASSDVNEIGQGGGIYDFGGNLTLNKVAVQSNTVTGTTAQGGGIYVSRGGNLVVQGGSVIQSNNATGASFAAGGGIVLEYGVIATIDNSTVANNTAVASPDVNDIAQGGGIATFGGTLKLNDVAVQSNKATGSVAQGGGLYVSGGGNLTIENGCVIQSNNTTGASFAAGGGVNVSGASSVVIRDSILSKNSATGEQGANGTSPGADGSDGGTAYGGGLDVNGNGWTVTLTGDTLSGNSTVGGNGGNGAAGQNASGANATGGNGGNGGQSGFATGGGAYFYASSNGSGHLTITDDPTAPTTNPSEFLDNSIQSGAGGDGGAGGTSTGTANNSNGGDGGVSNQAVGGALFISSSASGGTITATISNTTFSSNKVSGAKGGAGGAAGTGGAGSAGEAGATPGGNSAEGGGIGLENSVVATINNSMLANNTAGSNSGVNDVAQGGGIANFGGTLTLDKVVVQGNTVTGSAAQGGGVCLSRGGNLTIQGGSVIQSNRATAASTASGGGIANFGGTLTLNKVAVQGNTVTGTTAHGGGVYVSRGGNLNIQGGSAIQSNRATAAIAASGGGIYASAANTIDIRDSVVSNNIAQGEAGADGTSPGANGANGGRAQGGGFYILGGNWTMTLMGVTLSGNKAIGGNGGNGAAGSNATGTDTTGDNGGTGGGGGGAAGGAAYIFIQDGDSSTLTILDDPTTPAAYPSIMIDNSAQSGAGGHGGPGGTSTGNAANSDGGDAGGAAGAAGGALSFGGSATVNIGNTTIYGNEVSGGNSGSGGAAGTGGSGAAGEAGTSPDSGLSDGGGLDLGGGNITLVNSTVAKNRVTSGFSNGTGSQGQAIGGGIFMEATATFDNNTMTQNSISGEVLVLGSAIYAPAGDLTLFNNLIQGNESFGLPTEDLETGGRYLANASNNFITSVNANAVNTATNIVGNSQMQLGSVAGVDANGNLTGGPIYYPLLPGTGSVGAGTTSVLNTIAAVEGATPANATDAIGNPRSNNGSIDLGAIQMPSSTPSPSPSPPPPSPSPSPSPPSPPALNVPSLLALFDSLLGGTETVNADGTETITDSFFGIPLLVSTFDSEGNLVSVTLFGFNITFLFV